MSDKEFYDLDTRRYGMKIDGVTIWSRKVENERDHYDCIGDLRQKVNLYNEQKKRTS